MKLDNNVIVFLFIIIMCIICSLSIRISKVESQYIELNEKLSKLQKELDERNSHGIINNENVLEDENNLLRLVKKRYSNKTKDY